MVFEFTFNFSVDYLTLLPNKSQCFLRTVKCHQKHVLIVNKKASTGEGSRKVYRVIIPSAVGKEKQTSMLFQNNREKT